MKRRVHRFGAVVAFALGAVLVPWVDAPAEACTPRLFEELGPAPNTVVSPANEDLPPSEEAPPADEAPPVEDQTQAPNVTPPPPRCSFYYDMDYPVAGPSATLSVFGAIRDAGDRWHAGVDIAAKKLTPVVAVRDGVVSQANRNGGGDCCWMAIRHTDGWSSLYVHLNNDLFGTDDGTGTGIVRGLEVGDEVKRGQVVGYVGDSGNAEPGVPHLHFELRNRSGEAVDPLPSVRRARHRGVSGFGDLDNPPYDFDGPFADAPENDVPLIALAASLGMKLACDDYGLFFCPADAIEKETLVAWVDALVTDRLNQSTWGSQLTVLSGPTDAEAERFLRLCTEGCEQTLNHDGLIAFLHRVEQIPAEVLEALLKDDPPASCDPTEGALPVSRLQTLRTLMRTFGYLEFQAPEPPCVLIS